MRVDYYDILNVSHDASDSQIKKSYKRQLKKWHPDISKEPNASERVKEIIEAYEVLSKHRKLYDGESSTSEQLNSIIDEIRKKLNNSLIEVLNETKYVTRSMLRSMLESVAVAMYISVLFSLLFRLC